MLWGVILKSQKCIFEWSIEPKKRVLAIFWRLDCWIDLILHIVLVLNVYQRSAMLPGHEGSFKDHKNAPLNDPKSQKIGFWPFSGVRSVGSTWYCILWEYLMFSNVRQRYQVMNDHSKITKLHFWMIQRAKKLRSVGSTWYCILLEYLMFFNVRQAYSDR